MKENKQAEKPERKGENNERLTKHQTRNRTNETKTYRKGRTNKPKKQSD